MLSLSLDWICPLFVRAACWLCLTGGIALTIAGCGSEPEPMATPAETPSPSPPLLNGAEISNYARAVLDIEQSRKAAFQDIQAIAGDVPPFSCREPETIAELSEDIRNVATNYCQKSREIGAANNLTVKRFNEITENTKINPDLQRQIQNELIMLQR